MAVTETPLPKKTMDHIVGCARDALKVLGPEYKKADPAEVIEAVDDFAYRLQRGKKSAREVVEDAEEARLLFGSLWGEMLCEAFEWEWVQVTNHDEGDAVAFAVVSPKRSMAIYPLDFLADCFADPEKDVTVALAFNMLEERKVPKFPAGSYTDVMAGVHRIVPRD